jgi:hypothetical protein
MENLGVDGKISIFKKCVLESWNRMSWLKIKTAGGLL